MPLTNLLMKIAGKDPDGNVKGISVNKEGAMYAQIKGSNVVKRLHAFSDDSISIPGGESHEFTFEVNNYNSLRLQLNFNDSIDAKDVKIALVTINSEDEPTSGAVVGHKQAIDVKQALTAGASDRSVVSEKDTILYNGYQAKLVITNQNTDDLVIRSAYVGLSNEYYAPLYEELKEIRKSSIGNKIVPLLLYTETPIEIGSGEVYLLDRVNQSQFKFCRFQLTFDHGISPDDIELYYVETNKGQPVSGSANGMIAKVDIQAYPSSFSGSTGLPAASKRTIISDGDIPIFNDDIIIAVKNKSNDSMTLRQALLTLLN